MAGYGRPIKRGEQITWEIHHLSLTSASPVNKRQQPAAAHAAEPTSSIVKPSSPRESTGHAPIAEGRYKMFNLTGNWVDIKDGTPIEVTHRLVGNIFTGYEWVPREIPDYSKDYRPHDAPFW